MKKIIVLVICLLTCCACQKKETENPQMVHYQEMRNALVSCQKFDDQYDFQVRVVFNQLSDKYRYDVIIDQPQVNMYAIEAIAYAGEDENQMCPTIGLFDQDEYHLCVNRIDKEKGYYKGVQLSGECKQKKKIRLYISYYTNEKKETKMKKMIEV